MDVLLVTDAEILRSVGAWRRSGGANTEEEVKRNCIDRYNRSVLYSISGCKWYAANIPELPEIADRECRSRSGWSISRKTLKSYTIRLNKKT